MEQYILLEAGLSCALFPVVIELPFERNTAYLSRFSCVKNVTFVQNSSIQVNGGSTVSLVRNDQC
jgi:hypothetical protein